MINGPFVISSAETELYIAKIKKETEKFLGERITEVCGFHISYMQDNEKKNISCIPVTIKEGN